MAERLAIVRPGASCSRLSMSSARYQCQLPVRELQHLDGGGSNLYRGPAYRGGHSSGRRWFDKNLHRRLFYKRGPRWQGLPAT